MAFIFVCGTHTFTKLLEGYENVTCQCQNCGNYSGRVFSRWQWFTFCFVPVIPFSFKPWHEVGCHICHFFQDISARPDVAQMRGSSGQVPGQQPPQQYQGYPPHGGQAPQYAMQNYGNGGGAPQQGK